MKGARKRTRVGGNSNRETIAARKRRLKVQNELDEDEITELHCEFKLCYT